MVTREQTEKHNAKFVCLTFRHLGFPISQQFGRQIAQMPDTIQFQLGRLRLPVQPFRYTGRGKSEFLRLL